MVKPNFLLNGLVNILKLIEIVYDYFLNVYHFK